MEPSARGIALIKEFEGYAAAPYEDVAGKLSWGYGHLGLPGEEPPAFLSEEQATALLLEDMKFAVDCVNTSVTMPLTQDQFDALVSFVYNVGCRAFRKSTLLKKLNAGDIDGAAAEFGKWCYAGGRPVGGLLRRRSREHDLFRS